MVEVGLGERLNRIDLVSLEILITDETEEQSQGNPGERGCEYRAEIDARELGVAACDEASFGDSLPICPAARGRFVGGFGSNPASPELKAADHCWS